MATDESPHERFKRLAEARVNRALNDIRLIGNLSNRNNYEFTGEEVDKIFRVLDTELKHARARFIDGGRRETEFRL